jgi:hypothetical protein
MTAGPVSDERYDRALERMRGDDPPLFEVASLLATARDAGDPRAAYALATWYLHGKFFRRNLRKAVALLRAAARADIPEAAYDLAICHEKGEGVQKNEPKAAALYVQAALLGDEQALYEVGRCYYYGIGVARDRAIAWVWLDESRRRSSEPPLTPRALPKPSVRRATPGNRSGA